MFSLANIIQYKKNLFNKRKAILSVVEIEKIAFINYKFKF